MRLIDADNYCKNLCKCNSTECDKAKCPILNAPTAYDPDKVVAELEMKIDNAEFDEMLSRDEKDAYMDAYRRAIEIVKGGGVNDKS